MSQWKRFLVSHGFGLTRVDSPIAAIIFMDNLPGSKRGELLFEPAYKVCKRAARGEVNETVASQVFEAWARASGLLMPDVDTCVAASQNAAPPEQMHYPDYLPATC